MLRSQWVEIIYHFVLHVRSTRRLVDINGTRADADFLCCCVLAPGLGQVTHIRVLALDETGALQRLADQATGLVGRRGRHHDVVLSCH